MKLEYGMKVSFPACYCSGMRGEMLEGVVSKYWEDDVDANAYKVKVICEDGKHNSFYSSDLSSLIKEGTVKVLTDC